jgi:hypothetical protein
MPPRNLEAEFAALLEPYKASPMEHVNVFAELYITTLQSEKQTHLWDELSLKFPRTVRLYAMQHMRKSFMGRLKLNLDTVYRWTAQLELQKHDSRLARVSQIEGKVKEDQAAKVAQCLDNCTKLMLKLIKDNAPETVHDLRELLDSAYDFTLQLRVLEGGRKEFMKTVPCIVTKEKFHLFKEGVRAGKLYNKMMVDPKHRAQYYTHVEPMAMQLQADIVSSGSLNVLSKYPTIVQHHALGARQCVLVGKLQGRIPVQSIRAAVAAIKDELNPDTEVDAKISLLKGLRRALLFGKPVECSFRQWVRKLVTTEVNILPVKIILGKMRTVDPEVVTPKALKASLLQLLRKMPPRLVVPALTEYGEDIAQVAPTGYEGETNKAMEEYLQSL